MGIRDLFSSGGKSRAGNKLGKLIKAVKTTFGTSQDRYIAMQQLFDLAKKQPELATEAYTGLLMRFTIQSSKSIEDEEEKGWVYRELASRGKAVLPAISAYCAQEEKIAWALRLLEDIANEEEEWAVLDKLLEAHPAGSIERTPDKKIDILTHVQEIDDPKVLQCLGGYLDDRDESVRFFVTEALIDIGEEAALPFLAGRLANEEEDSLRIRSKILDGIAKHEWSIADYRDSLAAHLGNEHRFQDDKIVRA